MKQIFSDLCCCALQCAGQGLWLPLLFVMWSAMSPITLITKKDFPLFHGPLLLEQESVWHCCPELCTSVMCRIVAPADFYEATAWISQCTYYCNDLSVCNSFFTLGDYEYIWQMQGGRNNWLATLSRDFKTRAALVRNRCNVLIAGDVEKVAI